MHRLQNVLTAIKIIYFSTERNATTVGKIREQSTGPYVAGFLSM